MPFNITKSPVKTLSQKAFAPLKSLKQKTQTFHSDKSGIAAIEFALIAPIMIFIYFGLAEVASAISVDRRVSHTANIMGDLTTQTTSVTDAQMADIFAAAVRVLDINSLNNVTMEISSWEYDSTTKAARGIGKATFNSGQTLPAFDSVDLQPPILSPTTGVVVARIAYSYTPLRLRYTDADINLTELFQLKPRDSASVPIGAGTASTELNCSGSTPDTITCS